MLLKSSPPSDPPPLLPQLNMVRLPPLHQVSSRCPFSVPLSPTSEDEGPTFCAGLSQSGPPPERLAGILTEGNRAFS